MVYTDKTENYNEHLSDEDWFYSKLLFRYPDVIWKKDTDKYEHHDYEIGNCYIEFESSDINNWDANHPFPYPYINILSRKCKDSRWWTIFIKYCQDHSRFICITQFAFCKIKKMDDYISDVILNNSANRSDVNQNKFNRIPRHYMDSYTSEFFFDDENKLYELIDIYKE